MDSGNSGSMQSSSNGDEEFDSRTESISAFLTSSSTNPHHQQPPNPSLLFDSPSNFLSHHDPFSSSTRSLPSQNPNNPSLLQNLDIIWPRRSEPNFTHFNTSLMASSSSSPPTNFSHFQTPPPPPPPPPPHNTNTTSSSLPPPDKINSTTKNSKKRSRASRRAPTTVLTTDTSNFRAMVQEFTGIPAPPFSSSPFPRTRFDLFNNSSSSTNIRSGLLGESSPSSYLLRPFAQKLHPPSFLSSSSSSTNTVNPTSPNNYQLVSELALSNKQSTHHQNLLNLQNPSLTFQSLLHSSPPLPPSTTTTHNSQLKMGGASEDFGMNTTTNSTTDHHHQHQDQIRNQMDGIQNLLSTSLDPISSIRNENRSSWGDHTIGGSNNEEQDNLRVSFNGNNFDNSRRVEISGCKLNYSGSSPAEKETSADNHSNNNNNNNVSGRGEGMVDSWICSSD